MEDPIDESGMRFGPYPEGFCFHIEKSVAFKNLGKESPKSAEFLLLWPIRESPAIVLIVEAKSSAPREFTSYISDIREKFVNSLMMVVAVRLGRHGESAWNELPERFKTMDLKNVGYCFLLVINGLKDEWLPPLNDALAKALRGIIKTFALPQNSVRVVNDAWAREKRLIS